LSFWLESLIHTPKILVFGGFTSKPPKGLTCMERRVLSPHWSRSDAQCDLWAWQRKEKKAKKDSGKLAIHADHPRRRIKVKVCMPVGLQCVVLHIKFY